MVVSHLFSVPIPYSKKGLHNPYEFIGFVNIILKIHMNLYVFEDDAQNTYDFIRNYEGDEPV